MGKRCYPTPQELERRIDELSDRITRLEVRSKPLGPPSPIPTEEHIAKLNLLFDRMNGREFEESKKGKK